MGRIPCCEKENVKRGQWTPEEDNKLSSYIAQHGTRNWRLIPKNAGLQRCGKSCRLRWTNYLRPDLKHGQFSPTEEETIMKLHAVVGNRWSLIAAQLPGRTDNDVKNHWNTKLKKKLTGMGIDPVTHKSFSHLMAEIATTLGPPQVANLTEAALGCFKDEMLHLLTKKRIDFQLHPSPPATAQNMISNNDNKHEGSIKENTVEKIKLGLSRAIQQQHDMIISNKPNSAAPSGSGAVESSHHHHHHQVTTFAGFQYGINSSFGSCDDDGSPWSQSMCTGSTSTAGDHLAHLKLEDENSQPPPNKQITNRGSTIFPTHDSLLWDLPSDELINPIL